MSKIQPEEIVVDFNLLKSLINYSLCLPNEDYKDFWGFLVSKFISSQYKYDPSCYLSQECCYHMNKLQDELNDTYIRILYSAQIIERLCNKYENLTSLILSFNHHPILGLWISNYHPGSFFQCYAEVLQTRPDRFENLIKSEDI